MLDITKYVKIIALLNSLPVNRQKIQAERSVFFCLFLYMSKQFNHKCSCGKIYTDNDPDVYFCPSCVEQRKKVAEEVNKKLAGKLSSREGKGFEALTKIGRTMPSQSGGLATFFKASDLGI